MNNLLNFLQIFFLVFFFGFFLARFIWIKIVIDAYLKLSVYYCIVKKIYGDNGDMEKVMEYISIWPKKYFYIYFWQWNMRDFVLYKEKYDEVIKYFQNEFLHLKN